MKAYERHEAGVTTSYKLSRWDERSFTFREVRGSHLSVEAAQASATRPGRYRISEVSGGRFRDAAEFTV
jgi:hypothetical protein